MLDALGAVGQKRAIEALAEQFRVRVPAGAPPTPLDALAAQAGILHVRYSDHMDGSAALVGDVGGIFAVVLNMKDSRTRQRFSLAHEIGHRILAPEVKAHVLETVAHRGGRNDLEKAVDFFAACLLMPRDWVNEAFAEGLSLVRMASRFDVSQPAMRQRLVELGWARG